jgi:hypothetical protein
MSNSNGSVGAPPLVNRNTLQALVRLRGPQGSDWGVFAFVLNHDIIDKDGKVDDLRAMVFSLGSFGDQERAEKHARSIIELTGHAGIIVAPYAQAVPLTTKFDGERVVEVKVDDKGKLLKLESAQYKSEREEYERRVKREKELVKEAAEETNHDSIEYFKRQCYLAIKDRASYEYHKKQMDEAWVNYKKHEAAAREHYGRHPEHEEQWLPYMKQKLEERGESALYTTLENGYHKLREELLGPVLKDDCLDDICPAFPVEVVETKVVAPDNKNEEIEDSDDDMIAAPIV